MINLNRFYTYAYLREDRTPYYIGKGTGSRAHKKRKDGINPPKDKSRIIFLKQNLIEEEAFKHEKYMITVFGRKDLGTGILHNRTDGGEGSSGAVRSEEYKRNMSKVKKGKLKGKDNPNYGKTPSEEVRRNHSEKMKGKFVGERNPNYGRKHLEETKIKMREIRKGKKIWNDGCGNTKLSKECPGEGWVLGMDKKQIEMRNNRKWWNDGYGNTTLSIECPGDDWILGRGKHKNLHKDT